MQSITLQTNDTIVVSGDILGRVQFAASAESDGGAARLAGPGILGVAEGSFGSSSNPASLVFATSAADGNAATNRIKISHEGDIVPIGGSYDIGQSNGYGFNHIYVSGATVAGVREVKIDSGTTGGFINKKGDTGTWAFSIDAHGSSDTVHKGFGFHGSADSLTSIWIGGAYNTPYQKFTTTETVLNENGDDRDFRVEGDSDANLLFLDASKDSVLIGDSSDGSLNSKLHVYEVANTNTTNSRTVNILGRGYSTTDGAYYHIANNSRAEKYLSASTTDTGYCIGLNAVPVIYSPDGTNVLTELTSVRCNPSINSAASNVTVTNAYDIKTIPYFQGTNNTVTNHYGLYLGDAGAGGTTPTNEYGVYQVNTAATNYFGGTLDVRGAAVFNEGGADVDFRVEGDTDTDLLFVDAGNDIVQIGKLSINGAFTLPTADGSANQILKTDGSGAVSWSDAASGGSTITLTAGDGLSGGGDTSADRTFAVNVDDSTIEINSDALRIKDAAITPAKIGAGGFVFNEAGADVDFRVEGDTDANLLFVDASTDKIGIGNSSPAHKLDVNGMGRFVHADGMCGLQVEDSGGSGVHIGDCAFSQGDTFAGMKHSNHSLDGEYMIISKGTSTFVTSASGHPTFIRAGNGDRNYQAIFHADFFSVGDHTSKSIPAQRFQITNSGAAFNVGTGNYDFKVYGHNNATQLIHADAGLNRVGIGTSSPSKKLHVVGDLLIDDGSAIILDANGLKITDDTVGATLDTNLDDAIVIGEGSKSYADKSINIANGRFSSDGDCQKITQVLRGSTTNANIFYLSNDGSTAALLNSSGLFLGGTQYNSDHVLLPDNAVFTFTIHVSCRKQSSDDSAAFIIKGAVRNSLGWTDGDTMSTESNASSTRNYHLIDSPIIESFIDSGLAGVTATVTTSYLNPQTSNTVDNLWFGVEVKGLAGTNLRWSAMVDGILTTY